MRVSNRLIRLIQDELETDCISDDVTARLLRSKSTPCTAAITAKQAGTFCGEVIVNAFRELFPNTVQIHNLVSDGRAVNPGDTVVRLHCATDLCLSLERTLLNFLTHLCGVATLTRKYVEAVGDRPTKILATRKTLPGMREMQLLAVQAGGGYVHRRSLADGILIKENHQSIVDTAELFARAKASRSPLHGIEIEIQDLPTLKKVYADTASDFPDVVMLDNLEAEQITEALKIINHRSRVEVSGGIEVYEVKALADLGVDYISVGKLTHSAPALDLSLDILAERA